MSQSTFAKNSTELLPDNVLKIPLVRQTTDYSCGPAALASILQYWSVFSGTEVELFIPLNATPANGTSPDSLARVAIKFGLQAEIKQNMTLDDLRRHLDRGDTVILDIQAWRDDGDTKIPWSLIWDHGHYVVLVGMNNHNVYVMDPSLSAQYGYIPRAELMERWHDYEEINPPQKEFNYQLGIIIHGHKTPLNLQEVQRVE